MSILATLMVVFVAGCGQETVTLPSVVSVTPAQGSANVAVNATISATFNEPMSAASINATTFTVYAPNGVAVAGTVSYSGGVATFTPTGGALANSTTYTATITTGAATPGGAELIGPYVWSFTTITPAPLVVSTIPANNATGVPIGQVLRARFNEAMLCSTLQSPATTFTLKGPGTTTVTGTVTCSGSVATFTPGSPLLYNTLYTANISTAAQDLAGTGMAAAYQWIFTTVAAPPPAPAVISTVPINLAMGVPISQALSATFNEAMDPATINSATFLLVKTSVPGTPINGVITYVPAGSVATFTPNAPLLYNTNYTATVTSGALDLGDDAGVTTYIWTFTTAAAPLPVVPTVISTIPVSSPEDITVPLNQAISADFSVAMNPSTITATSPPTFTLTYLVGSVVTPVAGLVAYSGTGNELVFLPTANLLPSTTYTATITTAAQSLTGTPLASNYSWIFKTGATVSAIGPELVMSVPGNTGVGVEATNVALNQAISATFSEAMNPLTLTNATYQLYAGNNVTTGTPLQATITYDPVNFIATLTPTNLLVASSYYTAVVTTGATDLAGNPLGSSPTSPYTNPWIFQTGTSTITPPVVLGPTITPFGGFGGSGGMTNMGTSTVINGDIGTTAASTLVTGFHDDTVLPVISAAGSTTGCTYTETLSNIGLVTGVIYTDTPPPTIGCPNEGTAATDTIATEAASEALAAYNALQSNTNPATGTTPAAPQGSNTISADLGGTTLYPGVYWSASTVDITSGDLYLDAQGDPNAYFVFQVGSALTVGEAGHPRNVILEGGAQASHIFWVCAAAATINGAGGGTFNGTVLADASISTGTSGIVTVTTINGRLISLGLSSPSASTTLVNTVINVPPAP